jgi:hypothetical protein
MIVYDLKCNKDHVFEAWFPVMAAFDEQNARGDIVCPVCGDKKIDKAPMMPNLGKGRGVPAPVKVDVAEAMQQALGELHKAVEANFENVGNKFAEEARQIHYRESEPRNIFGEATLEEAAALQVEGIEFGVLPAKPRKTH